ncbi:MAG: hypothetical protein C0506_09395 [Anaerolinea sp.]|nr:hypothetical protein [Anaerolinea sp.]
MKLLLDMNLSPLWVGYLHALGWEVEHWGALGDGRAPDEEILAWARGNGWAVVTADLDFGRLTVESGLASPSVVLLRTGGTLPVDIGPALAASFERNRDALDTGTLLVFDGERERLRPLPYFG